MEYVIFKFCNILYNNMICYICIIRMSILFLDIIIIITSNHRIVKVN